MDILIGTRNEAFHVSPEFFDAVLGPFLSFDSLEFHAYETTPGHFAFGTVGDSIGFMVSGLK